MYQKNKCNICLSEKIKILKSPLAKFCLVCYHSELTEPSAIATNYSVKSNRNSNDNVEKYIKKHKSDNEELLSALKNDSTKPTTSAAARNNETPKEPKIKNNKPDYIDNIFSLNNPSFQKIIDNLIELYNNKKSNRRNGNQIS
jgi:hypothetical protein